MLTDNIGFWLRLKAASYSCFAAAAVPAASRSLAVVAASQPTPARRRSPSLHGSELHIGILDSCGT